MTYKILPDTETQIKFVSYTIDGVEYKIGPNSDNGVLRHQTEAEALAMATKFKDWDSKANERKLSEIKSIRLEKLQEILFEQQEKYNSSFLGKEVEVLIEKTGGRDDQIMGRSQYMQSVYMNKNLGKIGEIKKLDDLIN